MNATIIRRVMSRTKPPMNIYTSDGNVVYVDHPEAVLVSEAVIAIDPGTNGTGGVAKELIFLSPDHVVRLEHTKRKPLRKIAKP
jgi:hypothetical protein